MFDFKVISTVPTESQSDAVAQSISDARQGGIGNYLRGRIVTLKPLMAQHVSLGKTMSLLSPKQNAFFNITFWASVLEATDQYSVHSKSSDPSE